MEAAYLDEEGLPKWHGYLTFTQGSCNPIARPLFQLTTERSGEGERAIYMGIEREDRLEKKQECSLALQERLARAEGDFEFLQSMLALHKCSTIRELPDDAKLSLLARAQTFASKKELDALEAYYFDGRKHNEAHVPSALLENRSA